MSVGSSQPAVDSDSVTVVQTVHGAGGHSIQCFDTAGGSIFPDGHISTAMFVLGSRLRPGGDERTFVSELMFWSSGRHEFGYTFDLASLSPARIVWDHDYRYPGHPLPGTVDPAGAGESRPTDDRVLDEVRAQLTEFATLYAHTHGEEPRWEPGYSEQEIADAEARIGLRLPEDLRALYRCMPGDMAEHRPLGWFCALPLDRVVADYLGGAGPGSYGWDDGLFDVFPVVFESFPRGAIKRVSRSDRWVTFGSDFAMNHCAVDMDPGPAGAVGQLIEYGRDTYGPVRYVAESVLDLLRRVVALMRAGVDWRDDWTARGPEAPDCAHSEGLGARNVADVVADLAQPLAIQNLYLNDADIIDLDELAPLRNLRQISINRAHAVRGQLSHDLPIEAVTMEGENIDLDSIAGHPTMWALTVKSGGPPVDIAALSSLPALAFLDLGGADVVDVQRIADLPTLRVLALNRAQWQHLRGSDVALTGLAAAELSGHARLDDAIDWATWLTGLIRPENPPPGVLTPDLAALGSPVT